MTDLLTHLWEKYDKPIFEGLKEFGFQRVYAQGLTPVSATPLSHTDRMQQHEEYRFRRRLIDDIPPLELSLSFFPAGCSLAINTIPFDSALHYHNLQILQQEDILLAVRTYMERVLQL